jgi:hypothetical protein
MGSMETYERDFEDDLLRSTNEYYKKKAGVWVEQDSCPDYMLKAEEALRLEEERVEAYLHMGTKVQCQGVVEVVAAAWLHTGKRALKWCLLWACVVIASD